ncbi:hypothetical protein MASR1M97_14750 [Candidatus Desulfobacillus denitrificans]
MVPVMREMVGRTLSSTELLSLICGVTLITRPTATDCGVVVRLVSVLVCPWLVSDLTWK